MKPVIFLGPSVPLREASELLDAVYLPPCAMGDVLAAVERYKGAVIGIIDGFFERTPAVWHKEILHAMSAGSAVFGGGSMGALRAAELDAFGMVGVGRIYRAFAEGTLTDDDEVAVSHLGPEEGYRPLSVPMANVRYAFDLALAAGVAGQETVAVLTAAMKELYYPDRTWPALWNSAAAAGLPAGEVEALRRFVETTPHDLKRLDGLELLRRVGEFVRSGARPAPPAFDFEPTIFWEHLCAHRRVDGEARTMREKVLDHLRLAVKERAALADRALLMHLVQQEVRRLGMAEADDRTALSRFRKERGLNSPAALSDFMRRQRLSQEDCLALARGEADRRRLMWRYAGQVATNLPRVCQSDGRFDAVLDQVAAKRAVLDRLGIEEPTGADVESLDAVLAWYQQTFGPVHTGLEEHLVELGFGTPRQFTAELVATYLATQAEANEEPDAGRGT